MIVEEMTVIPLMILIITGIVTYSNYHNREMDKAKRSFYVMFGIFLSAICFIIVMATLPYIRPNYWKTKEAIKNNSYSLVQGKVENFNPTDGRGYHESFEINGIKFIYSDYSRHLYGFNKTSLKGGPIKGNDQELRIGYVWNEYYDQNVIVLIESKK